jgi:hypothetical protein
MGAHPTQAVAAAAFLLAFTALSAAIFKGSIVLYLVTAVLLAVSVGTFLKCKPLEHAENGGSLP